MNLLEEHSLVMRGWKLEYIKQYKTFEKDAISYKDAFSTDQAFRSNSIFRP